MSDTKPQSKAKCKNPDGHVFEVVRPAHVGHYGSVIKFLSIADGYKKEIEASIGRKWMPNKVFVYWMCKHCDQKKFEILSIEKTKALIKTI